MSSYPSWSTPAQTGPSQPRQSAPTSAAPTPSDPAEPDDTSPSPPPAGLGPLVEPHMDLNTFLESFWTRQMDAVERDNPDFKTYPLPLARIKKVMKSDEEVKMISAEAPIMFSKACELFISELTCRAWLIAESNKRRTLQKSDVAAAIALSDMFDFLIDIVPRDDGGEVDTGGGGDEVGEDGVNGFEGNEVDGGEGLSGGIEGGGGEGEEGDEEFGQYLQEG